MCIGMRWCGKDDCRSVLSRSMERNFSASTIYPTIERLVIRRRDDRVSWDAKLDRCCHIIGSHRENLGWLLAAKNVDKDHLAHSWRAHGCPYIQKMKLLKPTAVTQLPPVKYLIRWIRGKKVALEELNAELTKQSLRQARACWQQW